MLTYREELCVEETLELRLDVVSEIIIIILNILNEG